MSTQAYTSNRFALLATSAPSKQPQPRAQKDKATVASQKAQVAQELKTIKSEEQKKQVDQNRPAGGNAGRGRGSNNRGRGDNRGPRPDGERREPRPDGERREPRTEGDRRAPRKFDRRPGSGRPVNEEKKGSHGKGNWGSTTDTVNATTEVEGTEPTTEQPTTEDTPKEEEEPKTLTLAEFEKLKQVVQIDRPPPRVVEEDETLKNKYVKVEKKHESFVPGKGSKKSKDNKEKSAPKKQVIPIDQILDVKRNEDSRDRQSRGGRGGKTQGRGGRNQQSQFRLDDSAFPALG